MSKKLKVINSVSNTPLQKLNEAKSLKNPDKYVFLGVFTQCSTPDHKVVNRNNRIYSETEVLRHLGYLRDMIKENNGRLLGELDHPEGRFDVSMKEASHMITDLWYDNNTHCVMGRLEVLDTPNGKTLKELIDAGYPLYVSSRAAGDVNEKTKEVEIAQIFTYDVVCTPGFKEARLERVNENMNLSDKALCFINESISKAKQAIKVTEVEIPDNLLKESQIAKFNNITTADVAMPLNEEKDDEKPLNDSDVINKFLPQPELNPLKETEDESDSEKDEKEEDNDEKEEADNEKEEDNDEKEEADNEKEEADEDALTDEEKAENREMILDIIGLDNDGNPVGDSAEDKEDAESEEDNDDIIDIEAVGKEDEEETDDEEDVESEEDKNNEKEANEAVEKKSKIKKETDDDIASLESILNSVTKQESVKESIIRRYPFAISLSESNFAKFANLRPKLKKRCADFIEENQIYDIQTINELWNTPLREDKRAQQNWLKLASQSDIDLYVAASKEIQDAIEESAKYMVLETVEDVDLFWERTGLRQAAAQKIMNEKILENYNKAINEHKEFRANNPLGYKYDYVKMTEEWLKNNY